MMEPSSNGSPLNSNSTYSREIKLCVIIDSMTPIIMKVSVGTGGITLRHFKNLTSLREDCYKFYFKSQDSEFGVVKEEVAEDESCLPVYNDRIVAWVISNSANQLSLFEPEVNQHEANEETIWQGTKASNCPSLGALPVDQPDYQKTDPHDTLRITVQLNLSSYNFLGLTLVGPSDENGSSGRGIYVGKIAKNSVVEESGEVEVGDRIIEINDTDLKHMKNDDAVAIFRSCVEQRGVIKMVLERSNKLNSNNKGRFTLPREYANVVNYHTSPRAIETNCSSNDLKSPFFGNSNYQLRQNVNQHQLPCGLSIRGTHSLPRSITPQSPYGLSNHYGNTQTSGNLPSKIDSRSAYEPTTPTSTRQLDVALHCGKDDIYTIYNALRNDSKSLDIKDREWLKVVVKDAFLGSILVKWLSRNVYGFGNRREVKRFANQMLVLGLIRSPITGGAFSEKCYYILN